MPSGLTDAWHDLYGALREARALNRDDLPRAELELLDEAVSLVGRVLRR